MGSMAFKGELACSMHHLDFQHQGVTTGSVETGFLFFGDKLRIECPNINFAGQTRVLYY